MNCQWYYDNWRPGQKKSFHKYAVDTLASTARALWNFCLRLRLSASFECRHTWGSTKRGEHNDRTVSTTQAAADRDGMYKYYGWAAYTSIDTTTTSSSQNARTCVRREQSEWGYYYIHREIQIKFWSSGDGSKAEEKFHSEYKFVWQR